MTTDTKKGTPTSEVTMPTGTMTPSTMFLEAMEAMMLAVREAGKTLNNAIAEVREAVDFCRYYANEAENTLPKDAKAVGAIVAISPWKIGRAHV